MNNQTRKRFLFRGHAIPLAGHLRRPQDETIAPQAASSICMMGGRVRAETQKQQLAGGIVSFDRAESSVDADYDDAASAVELTRGGRHHENDLPATTTTWAVVQGLSIVNEGDSSRHELRAERVELRMSSHCKRGGKGTSIKPEAAVIEGLEIDGYALTITLREKMLSDHDTKDKLRAAYEGDSAFHAGHDHMFFVPEGSAQPGRRLPEAGGCVHCTLVEKIAWTGPQHPTATIDGNSIHVPDFGYVYLGEAFVADDSRRVSMMRIHLGSPKGGEILVVEADNDGHGWPP